MGDLEGKKAIAGHNYIHSPHSAFEGADATSTIPNKVSSWLCLFTVPFKMNKTSLFIGIPKISFIKLRSIKHQESRNFDGIEFSK